MDITKFYELRTRLYNTAAAGCMTVSEDFRLKRAVEDFKPLASANKAFEKLYALCEKLFSEKPDTVLPDCIALAEALAVTQGTFADNAETKPASGKSVSAKKPASSLAAVKELMRKGSDGLWKLSAEYKDTLRDPRVVTAFLNYLEIGKSNENFKVFCEIMCEVCGKTLVPGLKATVKASGRQLQYIAKLAGAEENEFFRGLAANEMTPEKVRLAAVSALSCSLENGALLAELYNTGKAKVKAAALLTMAEMDAPEAEPIFEKLLEDYEKNKKLLDEPIKASSGKACTEFVRKHLTEIINAMQDPDDKARKEAETAFISDVDLLVNKTELDDFYLAISTNHKSKYTSFTRSRCVDALTDGLKGKKREAVREQIDRLYAKAPKEFSKAKVFSDFINDPDKEPIAFEEPYDIEAFFGLFTYVPLLGRYYVPKAPFFNTYLLPIRPLGERLPDWLIRKIYEIADNSEKLFNSVNAPTRKEMLKKAEELGYRKKDWGDALCAMYDEYDHPARCIKAHLLDNISREDYPRVIEAAIYLAKKICSGFGGDGAFSILNEHCHDIDNKELINFANTMSVNSLRIRNSQTFPLHDLTDRLSREERNTGLMDLYNRISALSGEIEKKWLDHNLQDIERIMKQNS